MIRIAFPLLGQAGWMGGRNYLLNLIRVLKLYYHDDIESIVYCSDDISEKDLALLYSDGVDHVRLTSALNQKNSLKNLVSAIILGKNKDFEILLKNDNIDLVLECSTYFGWLFSIPTLAWFPDFQHRRMPHMFSRLGYWKREILWQLQVRSHRSIYVSSEVAKKDCEKFLPRSKGRVSVVHFATYPKAFNTDEDLSLIREKYNLPETFFYLPNQFWKHKNHEVVIKALGIIKESRNDVVVVASGNTVDLRHEKHFEELEQLINNLGLEYNFIVLGLIDYEDVFKLLRMCKAIINPSFFEGWSSTVEEAKAMGAKMILSDIDVHKEQAHDRATFFPGQDANALAAALIREHDNNVTDHTYKKTDVVRNEGNASLEAYAHDFVTTVNQAIGK